MHRILLLHTVIYFRVTGKLFGVRCYFITFLDDHSRYTNVHLLITKDKAMVNFKAFKAEVENIHKPEVKPLEQTQKENTESEFENFLEN